MKKSSQQSAVSSQQRKITKIIIIVFCPLLLALSIGEQAPDFTLPDLGGNKVSFPDDFKGRVVMIRFWTAMCHHCVREMPTIEKLFNKYRNKGLVVLAVNVGQPKEDVQGFLSGMTITYPVLLDLYSVTAKKYGFVNSPATFVIDRNGVIRGYFTGEIKEGEYENMIGGML